MSGRPLTDIENRWGQRVPVDVPVFIRTNMLEVNHGRLQNLSWSGGLLMTDFKLRLHCLIAIRFQLPPPLDLTVKAHVVRTTHGGVGLEWGECALHIIKELLYLEAQNSGGA
jgi:hypothetical protein